MNIGFVSTRFAGLDGVSLEAEKWAAVLEAQGHRCRWFAGELDKPPAVAYRAVEAHFQQPANQWIQEQLFHRVTRHGKLDKRVRDLTERLKAHLLAFVRRGEIDLLVVENASAIPMQVPLGLAIAEVIESYDIPAVGHHHDFFWERDRFAAMDGRYKLERVFPPAAPQMAHVVINAQARQDLLQRRSLLSTVIPNVFDFEHPPEADPERARALRRTLGVGDDQWLLLQPTRVIPRKGIEHAVSLAARLGPDRCTLVVTHPAGDEGFGYESRLKTMAAEKRVRIVFAHRLIGAPAVSAGGNGRFSLWEAYRAADFVTYPSSYEGFGNALLEAVCFRKPVLINRYGAYLADIRPAGFDLVEMDGNITDAVVEQVRAVLSDPAIGRRMVDHNFRCGLKSFSFKILRDLLPPVIESALDARKRPEAAFA